MTNTEHDRRIDYIEFSVKSVADAKRFYGSAFGWTFEDYGPDYASFADGRLSGGFQTVPLHFSDLSGNELAVWSDTTVKSEKEVKSEK